MYQSQIAANLKSKIDEEMNKFKANTSLMTLDEQISNAKSKDDLLNIKNQLTNLHEMRVGQELSQNKQKTRVLLKNSGFIDTIILFIIIGFVVGLGIGIGFILYKLK